MTPFERFLQLNRIKKKDIAAYLGILPTNIAVYCKEGSKLPDKHVERIKANTFGWDTSTLDEQPELTPKAYANKMQTLILENEMLRKENDNLNGMIAKLSSVLASYETILHNFIKDK